MAKRGNVETVKAADPITVEDAVEAGKRQLISAFPAIMKDIVEDARTKVRKCPACKGTTKVEGQDCLACDGSGETRQPGDKHARDLIFKFAQECAAASGDGDSFPSRGGRLRENQEMMEP